MAIWIFKSEPEEYSLHDLREAGEVRWDCIRNYGARNHLRRCRPGDLVLFYHSGKSPGIVGRAEVVSEPYPDPTQFDPESEYYDAKSPPDDPRWWSVDIAWMDELPRPVTLAAMKKTSALAELEVLRRARLSVSHVSADEYDAIMALS